MLTSECLALKITHKNRDKMPFAFIIASAHQCMPAWTDTEQYMHPEYVQG